MEPARVMVALPTLGHRLETLEHALRSCQNFSPDISLTVFLVSPVSAIGARALGAKYGAQVVDDPGSGMADAINAALEAGGGNEYYVWLGDDDLLVAEGIRVALHALENHPRAVVAYGQCEYIDSAGAHITTNRSGAVAKFLLPWGPNLISHPGTIVRMEAIRQAGGFASNLAYALDLDLFLRLRKLGAFLALPVVTAQFRWHAESLTVSDRRASSREAMKVKKQYLRPWLRWVSPLWNQPVAWASAIAARRVSYLASQGRSLQGDSLES